MVGTYKLLFCWKRNAASVVLTVLGGRDTQTVLDGKKQLNLKIISSTEVLGICQNKMSLLGGALCRFVFFLLFFIWYFPQKG